MNDLVTRICRKTPNFYVCVTILNGSPARDVKSLALSAINALKAKVTNAQKVVNTILGKSKEPGFVQSLKNCQNKYHFIQANNIVQAYAEVQIRDFVPAEDAIGDVANKVGACDGGFTGKLKSPLAFINKEIQDIARVIVAIIGQIN
ncbi:hypothetical protein Ancab_012512 [Ancistrocladus abbreviatus]